jgi:hypothetical protein
MKSLFFIVGIISLAYFPASAQKLKDSQVPASVKNTFEKKYPGVKGSWDKEDANYEVNFKQDGKSMSALIDVNGTIVETETSIPVGNLPQAVKSYVQKHYAGLKIKEAAKIVKASGEINYEAEVNKKDIVFDANGNFLKEAND